MVSLRLLTSLTPLLGLPNVAPAQSSPVTSPLREFQAQLPVRLWAQGLDSLQWFSVVLGHDTENCPLVELEAPIDASHQAVDPTTPFQVGGLQRCKVARRSCVEAPLVHVLEPSFMSGAPSATATSSILSGRAFRALAKAVPRWEWNFEAWTTDCRRRRARA
jgi:hypothetical protein